MEIKDPKVVHDYLNGVIEGEDVKKSTKLYSNAKTTEKSVNLKQNVFLFYHAMI